MADRVHTVPIARLERVVEVLVVERKASRLVVPRAIMMAIAHRVVLIITSPTTNAISALLVKHLQQDRHLLRHALYPKKMMADRVHTIPIACLERVVEVMLPRVIVVATKESRLGVPVALRVVIARRAVLIITSPTTNAISALLVKHLQQDRHLLQHALYPKKMMADRVHTIPIACLTRVVEVMLPRVIVVPQKSLLGAPVALRMVIARRAVLIITSPTTNAINAQLVRRLLWDRHLLRHAL
jgi:hypothetical protein